MASTGTTSRGERMAAELDRVAQTFKDADSGLVALEALATLQQVGATQDDLRELEQMAWDRTWRDQPWTQLMAALRSRYGYELVKMTNTNVQATTERRHQNILPRRQQTGSWWQRRGLPRQLAILWVALELVLAALAVTFGPKATAAATAGNWDSWGRMLILGSALEGLLLAALLAAVISGRYPRRHGTTGRRATDPAPPKTAARAGAPRR